MPEVLFYHLQTASLDEALPSLLERTRDRHWRAVVRVGSAERMEALDAHLWSYSEQSFLAHGTAAEGHEERQPIYLTVEDENPNGAQVLFLTGGATPEDWAAPSIMGYARIALMFDGGDAQALALARVAWKNAKAAGHDATYWKQTPSGGWAKET